LSISVNGTTVIAGSKDGKITGFGRPVFATGKKLRQAAERLYGISDDIWYRAYEIDDFAKFLLEKGYEATPYFTQVIDLFIRGSSGQRIRPKTEQELHVDVRKSYKSLISKNENVKLDAGLLFSRNLHIECAGRETRSVKTWEIQNEMIKQEEAFSFSDNTGLLPIAFGFFIYNNHTCYYGVGASLEGVNSHALIWKAILHAKELGCKYFEMGEQVFSGDEKLVNISKFKRGFGGTCQMRLDLRKKE